VSSGINQIIRTLLDPQNPIYISILIVLFILGLVYFVYKYGIDPAYEVFRKEKENLEFKSAKMMAQFAELDPDPVIRIDSSGSILETNQAAKRVFVDDNIKNKNISEILPTLNFETGKPIITETRMLTHKTGTRFYSILYRGDAELQIAQIYFRDTTEAKEYEEKLLNYQTRLKTLSESLQELIEQERRKIARGLHDGIGQSLSFLRIRFFKMKDKADENSSAFFQESIDSIEEIIKDLKDISHSLKPRTLEEMGLQISVKNMINKVCEETEIYGELNMPDNDIRFDEKVEINIYRIVQEAINNLVKYSRATNFSVQLVNSSKLIRLIITDNGIGFDAEELLSGKIKQSGMGLINMKERVESLNGKFKIDSFPGNGTMLVAEIPIKERQLWHTNNQYVS
jgi:signal transduction histidine kinase